MEFEHIYVFRFLINLHIQNIGDMAAQTQASQTMPFSFFGEWEGQCSTVYTVL